MKDITKCKLGMFIHHTLKDGYFTDGSQPKDMDELADAFDTEGFADSLVKMGVEYIIYTAWNFKAQPLFPSPVTEKFRPGNSPKRDLLGDIIDSVTARGIHVMLYTHPRDGHDFTEEEKENTGWGRGGHPTDNQAPDYDNFNNERWNEYTLALYEEVAERYATRLTGYYTDSNGPKDPPHYQHSHKDHQIVNYLKIRNMMKSHNPDLLTFQNHYGYVYTNDFGNNETYISYLTRLVGFRNAEKWHCAKRSATTLAPFGSWTSGESLREESALVADKKDLLRYVLFNGSCSVCGNVLFASGTFAEGNVWQTGVVETVSEITGILREYEDSFMDAVPSLSYPTMPGSTLESNNYRFWMTGKDAQYEYLHCICLPEDGVLEWGLPEDGITLMAPVVQKGDITITGITKTETGYRMTFTGTPDPNDTVFCFRRVGTSAPAAYEWVNNDDKRCVYTGSWYYTSCWLFDDKYVAEGCYERDAQCACAAESCMALVYNGSVVEVYGVMGDGFGAADVYIDGIFCGTVDEQAAGDKHPALLYRSDNLYGGQHILQLYTKNDKKFFLDAVKVIY